MKALGIILAGGNSNRMQELTSRRAVSAMSAEAIAVLILRSAI